MQRALRAQWRDAWDRRGGLPLEDSLNRQWARNIGSNQAGPAFPFWLSAILSGCETPNDLGREVATWRKRTGQLRQRRTTIENELLDGNLQTTAPYEQAITGMVEELPEAKVIAGVTGAAIAGAKSGLMLTGLPPFLADSAGALLDPEVLKLVGPKTSWLMRVTRPRLWFLAKANASAVQLTEPTYRLKELFALPEPPAGTRELLARANTLEWAL